MPTGTYGHGYYNFNTKGSSISGHLKASDIEKIVLKNYPNAYEIVITQGQDGNNIYYIADFLTDKFDGELKLDPVTGAICERELEYF